MQWRGPRRITQWKAKYPKVLLLPFHCRNDDKAGERHFEFQAREKKRENIQVSLALYGHKHKCTHCYRIRTLKTFTEEWSHICHWAHFDMYGLWMAALIFTPELPLGASLFPSILYTFVCESQHGSQLEATMMVSWQYWCLWTKIHQLISNGPLNSHLTAAVFSHCFYVP